MSLAPAPARAPAFPTPGGSALRPPYSAPSPLLGALGAKETMVTLRLKRTNRHLQVRRSGRKMQKTGKKSLALPLGMYHS